MILSRECLTSPTTGSASVAREKSLTERTLTRHGCTNVRTDNGVFTLTAYLGVALTQIQEAILGVIAIDYIWLAYSVRRNVAGRRRIDRRLPNIQRTTLVW